MPDDEQPARTLSDVLEATYGPEKGAAWLESGAVHVDGEPTTDGSLPMPGGTAWALNPPG